MWGRPLPPHMRMVFLRNSCPEAGSSREPGKSIDHGFADLWEGFTAKTSDTPILRVQLVLHEQAGCPGGIRTCIFLS